MKQSYPYRVLPPLTTNEYAALKADIAAHGLGVPIETDEDGNILDGEHRHKACRELGILNPPCIVRPGFTEDQKLEHVLALNLRRRHVSKQELRNIAEELRKRGWTQDQISATLSVSQKTVSNWLAESRNSTELQFVMGKDGKLYPTKKKDRALKQQSQLRNQETTEETNTKTTVLLHELCKNKGEIEEYSVDLLLTSSPLDDSHLWDELGSFAAHVLKPGKLLVLCSGQKQLPEIVRALSNHLQYVWTGSLVIEDAPEVSELHIYNSLKIVLFFARFPYEPGAWFNDLFMESDPECALESVIEELTDSGDTICDPFGDDRIAAAATRLNRVLIRGGTNCSFSPAVDRDTKTLPSPADVSLQRIPTAADEASFNALLARIDLRHKGLL
jgi:ParB-like chromosome segregation protein Spo0J